VHDGAAGVVIDPQRDVDRMLARIATAGVTVTHVLETHTHNDYVTGGWELARQLGAVYGVPAGDEVSVDRLALQDEQECTTGSLVLRAVHTPGHTPNHLSYVAVDEDGPRAVFTGGSLLFGTVGRTDLLGAGTTGELTRRQYRSAQRLARLPRAVSIYPTHGFGSFCASASGSEAEASTIGDELAGNIALTNDEDTFVSTMLDELSPYPAYYAHIAPINLAGGAAWDPQLLPDLGAVELHKQLTAGSWVVDLRDRREFAKAHVPGSVGIEHATLFSTYLGWLRPWGPAITLIGAERGQITEAQRDLSRIGVDALTGASTGDIETLVSGAAPGSYPVTDFAGLARRGADDVVVLDVRQDDEWHSGHICGATHIPVQEVHQRRDEVPSGAVWVHCGSGYRASIAASLLDCAGRHVVLIDDFWDNAGKAGLAFSRE
jgi:glyoxylase-like metal-dependent hydrolase (beta-lactamase superfamily II)/rhodanese-related sulfurtransferase